MRQLRAILANTTTQIGHHGCTLVNRRIHALAQEAGIEIVKRYPSEIVESALNDQSIDLVIANGEGSLHDDSKDTIALSKLAAACRDRNLPAYLVNSIWESISQDRSQQLGKYRLIYLRDSASQDAAAKQGIEASVVPDLTLSWMPESPHTIGRRVVVTDATQSAARANLYKLANRIGADYLPLRTAPDLLPDYPDGNWRRRMKFELKAVAAAVAPQGPWRAGYRDFARTFDTFTQRLAQGTGLLITGRFHGVCIALTLGVPILAMSSNTRKIESLLADIGLRGRMFSDPDILVDRIRNEGITAFEYSSGEHRAVEDFLTGARKKAIDMMLTIAEDARSMPRSSPQRKATSSTS